MELDDDVAERYIDAQKDEMYEQWRLEQVAQDIMKHHKWQVSDLDDPDVFTGVLPIRCYWCGVAKHRSTNDECAYPNGEGLFQRGEGGAIC